MTGERDTGKCFRNRARNGRYTFDGDMSRLCVCGHPLAIHAGAAPHDCFNEDRAGGGTGEPCSCKRFRLSRGKRTAALRAIAAKKEEA